MSRSGQGFLNVLNLTGGYNVPLQSHLSIVFFTHQPISNYEDPPILHSIRGLRAEGRLLLPDLAAQR